MTLTYAGLQRQVAEFLNRGDLYATIPALIALAEAQLNRRLDCAEMIGRDTAQVEAEFVETPDDFAGVVSLCLAGAPPEPLEPRAPAQLAALRAVGPAEGRPRYYTVVGRSLQLSPAPDTAYAVELTYRNRVPALSAAATTNWLLAAHPDAYLYGALLAAAPLLPDDGRLPLWQGLFEAAIKDINGDGARVQAGG